MRCRCCEEDRTLWVVMCSAAVRFVVCTGCAPLFAGMPCRQETRASGHRAELAQRLEAASWEQHAPRMLRKQLEARR